MGGGTKGVKNSPTDPSFPSAPPLSSPSLSPILVLATLCRRAGLGSPRAWVVPLAAAASIAATDMTRLSRDSVRTARRPTPGGHRSIPMPVARSQPSMMLLDPSRALAGNGAGRSLNRAAPSVTLALTTRVGREAYFNSLPMDVATPLTS